MISFGFSSIDIVAGVMKEDTLAAFLFIIKAGGIKKFERELAHYDVAVQHASHYATRTHRPLVK